MDKKDLLQLNSSQTQFLEKCQQIAEDIQTDKTTILCLVENLQELLLNTRSDKRENGLNILSKVLENLDKSYLNGQQVEHLTLFYLERLKDVHVVSQTLPGLLVLVGFTNFNRNSSKDILKTLLRNVACQQQALGDRLLIYKLFKVLSEIFLKEMLEINEEFVYGIIQSISNERDPRNILFLFDWIPHFVKNFNLGHLSEEMFDILASYYPIDYKNPQENKERKTTRENLSEALKLCLTSSPNFAEFCFPLILEKLDSSLEIATLDSLKLLRQSCETFPIESFHENWIDIWAKLMELLYKPSTSKKIESESLFTLEKIIQKMSSDENLKKNLAQIIDSTKGNLISDKQIFETTSKIFISSSRASKESSQIILQEVGPIIVNLYKISVEKPQKINYLTLLAKILFHFLRQNNFSSNNFIDLILEAASSQDLNLSCNCLNELSLLSQFLPKETRSKLYEILTKKFEFQDEKTQSSLRKCIKSLACFHPQELQENVLEKIMFSEHQINLLKVLNELVSLKHFQKTIIQYYLQNSFKQLQNNDFFIFLNILFENNWENQQLVELFFEENLLEKLIVFSENTSNRETIDCLIAILNNFVVMQSEENQTIIVKCLNNLQKDKTNFLTLLCGVLPALRLGVFVNLTLIEELILISLTNEDCWVKSHLLPLIGNLINKQPQDDSFDAFLQKLMENKQFLESTELIGHITKALLMRNHHFQNNWVNLVLQQTKEYNKKILSSYLIIMDNACKFMQSKFYCTNLLFYRQKFFTISSNFLSENFGFEDEEKGFFVSLLVAMLDQTPCQAITSQFNKIAKLLIFCLENHDNSQEILTLLKIIKQLLENRFKIDQNLEEFLIRLINLAQHHLMEIRILALQCLQILPETTEVYKLIPHQKMIIEKLLFSLDDKKRLVRQQATRARSIWFLL